jgi:hypothetical protein
MFIIVEIGYFFDGTNINHLRPGFKRRYPNRLNKQLNGTFSSSNGKRQVNTIEFSKGTPVIINSMSLL